MAEKKCRDSVAKGGYHCPYCDEQVQQANLPWCQACGVKLTYCPQCGKPVAREVKACPHCGRKFPVP